MNGAESLVRTLVAGEVDVCFANPGTSEMHFVAALDRVAGMRCILGLFEGVVTGAADGYYRMTERPAATLLHLGPGLANGVANLHNAQKAKSGIVNIVGQHARAHLAYESPLFGDVEGIARPVSHWLRTSRSASEVAGDAVDAIAAARAVPGQIATLILPGDTAWDEGSGPAFVPPRQITLAPPRPDAIEAAARRLRSGEATVIVIGERAVRGPGMELAGAIAAHTGARLVTPTYTPLLARGVGRVNVGRIPFVVDRAVALLKDVRHVIAVETGEPIAFFRYPGKPSLVRPEGSTLTELTLPGQDLLAALEALAEAVGAKRSMAPLQRRADVAMPRGPITPETLAEVLAVSIPENAIVVDESVSVGRDFAQATARSAPHDWIQNMGGSIGYGTPLAIGAAIACPQRRVLTLVGDGSAMYTFQSLWTQAREGLDVTTLVLANRTYQILIGELANVGAAAAGRKARDLLEIDRPTIDFVALARSMGVPGEAVDSAEALCAALARANAERGPHLIEARM